MQWRHEWKHEISPADRLVLRQRLSAVCTLDPHAVGGSYQIRSLYFDNLNDRALREKLDGVDRREKWRIRYYNGDTSLIHLERKAKAHGLGTKQSCELSASEARAITEGDVAWMATDARAEVRRLYTAMTCEGMRPRTIVDYRREPYLFDAGNVRVTMDYDIATGLVATDFLDPDCPTIPVPDDPIILEVKWDAFLPSIVRDAVQLTGRRTSSYSKYASARMYD